MSFSNKEIHKAALQFRKKYLKKGLSLSSVKSAITSQGFTILEYNSVYNEPDVEQILSGLKIRAFAESVRGFSFANKDYRIVFVNEDLSEEEKIKVLVHEAGHIFLDHIGKNTVIGSDVQEEFETNEFTHYILKPTASHKINIFLSKHKKAIISTSLLFVAILAVTLVFMNIQQEKTFYGEYYITETGTKYHKKDCIYIKNKTNIKRLTKEEFESGKYEPCKVCLP